MAGHSKWAKLKHKKGKTDAQKSKLFSKLVRFISVEAKKSKGDRNAPGLRAAIDNARAENMPAENIDRAIEKANTSGELEKVVYEAYGPGGVALVVEAYTDNRNRTAQEIKHILSENGVELASPGAAAWAFVKTAEGKLEAQTTVDISDDDGAKLTELVEGLEDHDDVSEVYTNAA
ncbi:MAG: YebC/PmpR family DNA-binding transcriptional regulator [Candidatus Adlerbacteria bacterium]|nr:YebC/PmpR family DNA-binding transcriptional regulator [Candidatus Adlerbacteria bacterium]MDZ4226114.1 YebC/PmpR family DNA-binding transcriptional regulator [Patescibacteria group bacterium]